ncbi:hypothetical protein RD792_006507 [Penstemon davidsonii]|uniref:pyruvate dehydrogenase (acetyl-transferring) n=1 Tax=Penstemon davidsonii TaxID=160366 RepID=A0ABR0DD50_9LAMI|nr:hypothetical protein RD792_006507 [Penstemon davidsonii]
MDRDPRVCVFGEDVGHYGGSYKVTKGLAEKYGDLRVLDTPIAENSFTGMAVGAAMTGLRPIVEGMNMGFLLLAFNQISDNCGMLHYTSGGQFTIPTVIRGPGGVGRQLGAEHSQRLESYFQSIPGIQMVACSTPYNAKGLMKAAIRSENPVVLFEHVLLYNLKERIPDEEYVLSLEEAEMVRPGEHVTILTYSRMRYHVMQAAKTLVNKGYDPEVIDIRSLKPFDLYTIGNSIKKTHRVLIVEECMRTGGIGASLTAAINENFHDYLDAQIVCLSSQDVPTPYAGTLEEWTVVQPPQIVAAVEQLLQNPFVRATPIKGAGLGLGVRVGQKVISNQGGLGWAGGGRGKEGLGGLGWAGGGRVKEGLEKPFLHTAGLDAPHGVHQMYIRPSPMERASPGAPEPRASPAPPEPCLVVSNGRAPEWN